MGGARPGNRPSRRTRPFSAHRDPIVAAGRTADVRRQAVDGTQSRSARAIPGPDDRGVRGAAAPGDEDPWTAWQVAAPPGLRTAPAEGPARTQEARVRGERRRSVAAIVGRQHAAV